MIFEPGSKRQQARNFAYGRQGEKGKGATARVSQQMHSNSHGTARLRFMKPVRPPVLCFL